MNHMKRVPAGMARRIIATQRARRMAALGGFGATCCLTFGVLLWM